jgi:2-polyprenyl-3-methyl-5-hydroxy-6-metoxy-1,4-benzoquinol methylase
MADLTSISTILKSEDFWLAGADAQKYLHHKFQDFGYRLATQLGDLEHKSIYMRLAKSEDKAVIDQALGFALDYRDEQNKGKLFMWKLQQIRKERKKKRAMQNFTTEFVMQEMSQTFDRMASEVTSKQKSRLDLARETTLHRFAAQAHLINKNRKKPTLVLDLGCGSGVDARCLTTQGLKVEGVDVSRALVRAAKLFCPEGKFTRQKDMLTSSHKPGRYAGIWADKFWQLIPFADEEKYLVRLHELLLPGGHLYLCTRVNDVPEQKWQPLEWRGEELLSFFKVNAVNDLVDKFTRLGFAEIDRQEVAPHTLGLWLTKSLG